MSISITCNDTTVTTPSGGWLDLIDPDPAQIHIADIAHHHAGTKRFNACLDVTIAEHVSAGVFVLRAKFGPLCATMPWLELAWVLHEGHEPYTGDIVSPMAKAVFRVTRGIDGIEIVKMNVQQAVHERFGLPWPLPADAQAAITYVDRVMRATEVRDCRSGETWSDLPEPWFEPLIKPMDEKDAGTAFLDAFIDAAAKAGPIAWDVVALNTHAEIRAARLSGAS